ncbi:hypothetical protein R4B61_07485 (plasmid) [Fructilactobacillus vespulae]|uniref:hypothetical protein n=1 Tax=Fructilactobacillus vespulae TaxID=1249630 RepID=UPI0039B4D751
MAQKNEAEIRNIGVAKGVYTLMKMGMFFVRDILTLVVVFGSCVLIGNIFPPDQFGRLIFFYIWNLVFTAWLVFPSFNNPGKRTYNLIWDSFFSLVESKKLKSFDYYEFDSIEEFAKIGGGLKHGN